MNATATYLTVEEAQRIVLEHVRPGRRITLPLSQALGYTLAEPVRTDIDYPPFDRSVMDGFALRAQDTQRAPVTLKLVGEVAAGASPSRGLGDGEAMRINTGAPMPAGADAVARLEDTEALDGEAAVRITTAAKPGQHIALRAEYASRGQIVLEAGRRLWPGQIGVAGAAGAHHVQVYARPEVAVLSTGTELVDIDQTPAGAQIRNSNSYVLMALVEQAGARPHNLGNVPDDRAPLELRIREGLKADVLCITGGVSVGQFDLVPGVLRACGVHLYVQKLKTKPGKPTIFGVGPAGTLVFALPGNPISAFVGFWLLARPALAALQGRTAEMPHPPTATLRGSLKPPGDRRSYIPAKVAVTPSGEIAVEPLPWGGSGDPFGLARADALIVRPMGAPAANDGDPVQVMLLDTW